MAFRAFFSDKDGEDKKRFAQSKEVRFTRQPSDVKSPMSVGTTASDILAILEVPATYIRNVKLHLTIIRPGCRRFLLLIGLRGQR